MTITPTRITNNPPKAGGNPPNVSLARTQVRQTSRRPARVLLIGLSLLVAAFVVFATVLVQQVTGRTMAKTLVQTPPEASVVVQAGDEPVSPDALAAIRTLPGVAEAVGQVTTAVEISKGKPDAASDAAARVYMGLIADPGSGPFTLVRVKTGTYPKAPGEVAVTQRTADRRGLRVGRRIEFTVADREKRTTTSSVLITGIVEARDDYGSSLYTRDDFAARILESGFERITVAAKPATDLVALRQAIAAHLPSGSQAPPRVRDAAAVRAEEAEQTASQFKTFFLVLDMFLLVTVIAAAIVASSTYRVVFAQRMRQLALLRAVGAGRGPLIRAMVAEGALTGLITGVVGVIAAYASIQALIPVLSLFDIRVQRPGHPIVAAVAVVLGTIAVSLACVLAPAVSASKVAPLEALRTSAASNGRSPIGRLRGTIGVLCALVAVALAAIAFLGAPGSGHKPNAGVMAAVVFSGIAAYGVLIAFGPQLLPPVLRVVGYPIRRTGAVGALAVGGVGGAPRRAASISAVVALGVALVSICLICTASIQGAVKATLAAEAPADFHMTSAQSGEPLSDDLVQRLRTRGELDSVTPYRVVYATDASSDEPKPRAVSDLDVRTLPHATGVRTIAGSLSDVGPGRVAVGWFGAHLGETVRLQTGDRQVTAQVVAVLSDRLAGAVAIAHPSDLDQLGAPQAATDVLVDAATTGEAGRTAALSAIHAEIAAAEIELQNLADQRDEFTREEATVTTIPLVLLSLTILIALVGVGTTTALNVVERARESGLLRAVGISRRGLRRMMTGEAALYGMIGSAFGLVSGIPYAWLFVRAMGMPTLWPVVQLAIVVLVVTIMTALAGVLPGRRAAKASPIAAIATE